MSFDERYQLLQLAEDESAKTFVAREISTGKRVTVFLFVGEQARAQSELLDELRAADRQQLPGLIEVGDNRGTPYVVTEPIGGFSELKSRISSPKPAPPASPAHKPEEFSKAGVWRVPPVLQTTPSPAEKPSGEPLITARQQPIQAPAQSAPGSFTQMFQAPAPPIGEPKPEAPKAPPPPPVAPPPVQSAPGSFTQMFQAPAPPIGEPKPEAPKAPPPPPVTPPPVQSGPGEFTRFFKSSSTPSAMPMPVPQKPEAQGEFARVFGSGGRVTTPPSTVTGIFSQSSSGSVSNQGKSEGPSAPKPPQAYTASDGEFTRIFGDTSSEIPTLGPIAAVPNPPTPPPAGAPGEYTRMFGAQPIPQEPIAAPAPAPIRTPESPAPAKQTSKMVPVLIGVIVLLLAAIAIIVITMRK